MNEENKAELDAALWKLYGSEKEYLIKETSCSFILTACANNNENGEGSMIHAL